MSKLTEALFPRSTHAVLSTLFTRPDGLHLRGLMSATGLGSASAQRELKKLLDAGILTRKENGKVLLYQPNVDSPVYAELRAIIEKTDGVAQTLRNALLPFVSGIEKAFIYGSLARAEDHARSDIDLLVIADTLGSADLYPAMLETEKLLGRRISLTIYRPDEFERRLHANNHFLSAVMAGPRIDLIGGNDEQQGFGESRENRPVDG
jgi:predicted nucleotidyltransferase